MVVEDALAFWRIIRIASSKQVTACRETARISPREKRKSRLKVHHGRTPESYCACDESGSFAGGCRIHCRATTTDPFRRTLSATKIRGQFDHLLFPRRRAPDS